MSAAYRSAFDEKRGRHLVANRCLFKNELVFNERPLLALQSLGNSHDGALCCKHCKAFLFCRETHLALHSKDITRDSITCDDNIISCRGKCGEYFCSHKCESDAWNMYGHCFLCTGRITEDNSEEHPLLRFKIHAVQTNEIFLMVADWLTRVICLRARNIQYYEEGDQDKYSLDAVLKPFCDFTMVPWWDVCSGIEHLNQQAGDGYSDEEFNDTKGEGGQDHTDLSETLRRLCCESAELLRGALISYLDEMDAADTITSHRSATLTHSLTITALNQAFSECVESDLFTGEFIAKVIGSFEQNVIGIRARHPLCNDILFGVPDKECDVAMSGKAFRRNHRNVILRCLDESGLFEDDFEVGKDVSNGDDDDSVEDAICCRLLQLELSNDDDAAPSFYGGDDMDRLFTPLDGTAIFSLACKMNHSCAPNVLVRYRCGWGEYQPLVLQCIALRDIDEGEELCISYIRSDGPLEARQDALQNYGFRCECSKCKEDSNVGGEESHPQDIDGDIDEDGLFGSDSEDGYEEEDLFSSDSDEGNAVDDSDVCENISPVGEVCNTSAISDRIKKSFDSQRALAEIPYSTFGSALSFVLLDGSTILSKLEFLVLKCKNLSLIMKILRLCIDGASKRHLRACGWYGQVGECVCFGLVNSLSWPSNIVFAESYGCFAVAASLGLALQGRFIDSARMLDKAMLLTNLKRKLRKNDLFEYVFYHAKGCVLTVDNSVNSMGNHMFEKDDAEKLYLDKPVSLRVPEMNSSDFVSDWFSEDFLKASKPLVIRGLACSWKAVTSWGDFSFFAEYGHRLVSVLVGSMNSRGKMIKNVITIHQFFESHLMKSHSVGWWTLADMERYSDVIACISELRLFEQFPELLHDFDKLPFLDDDVALQQKVIISTGGLRSGLHYDSFENVFVQLVGATYIRIYSSPEVFKLYAFNEKYNSIDCELDEEANGDISSLSKVTYFETILHPGDAIYIPSGCWHYTRSLSSSISVNYFWWHQEEVPQLVYSV